jgi:hypothetical protein
VLPDDGWKVAIAKTPQGMHHRWVKSFEEQASFLERWSDSGYDTYHACATYEEPGSSFSGRKRSKVYRLGSIWADIDTREGKPSAPYADRKEAAEALGQFCLAASLPPPTIVNSGFGLHVYWPLQEPMPLHSWLPFAEGLKRLAARHGFKIDPSRTADAASILRTPGTKNWKRN